MRLVITWKAHGVLYSESADGTRAECEANLREIIKTYSKVLSFQSRIIPSVSGNRKEE